MQSTTKGLQKKKEKGVNCIKSIKSTVRFPTNIVQSVNETTENESINETSVNKSVNEFNVDEFIAEQVSKALWKDYSANLAQQVQSNLNKRELYDYYIIDVGTLQV